MPKRYKLIPSKKYRTLEIRHRGYLPHWQLDDSIYSITYRLADSLPQHIYEQLLEERKAIQRLIAGNDEPSAVQRNEINRIFAVRLDIRLDEGWGSCHLRNPEVVRVVVENLHHHDGGRYRLEAYALMPNHVHVVMHLFRGSDLPRVLHSWKSYTGKCALAILGEAPPFWQEECFDRIVRDEEDYANTLRYVLDNPLKAGLKNWPWVWRRA